MEYKYYSPVVTDRSIDILSEEEVFQSSFSQMKAVANANIEKQKDLMYVKFILCHEGPNLNNDYFLREELDMAYPSIVYKVYNWEHGKQFLGAITDSVLVKPPKGSLDSRWRIECGAVVWKWLVPKYAQQIASKAPTGELRNSMECYYSDYVYVLGDEDIIYTREERPDLEEYIGKLYNGVRVYRGYKNMFFGGAGVVQSPADPDAVFMSVASKEKVSKEIFDINKDNIFEFVTEDVEKEVLYMGESTKKTVEDIGIKEEEKVEEVKDKDPNAVIQVEDVKKEDKEVEKKKDMEAEVKDLSVKDLVKGRSELYKEAASLVQEILYEWDICDHYHNLYSALNTAIHTILWDDIHGDTMVDKEEAITNEIIVFVSELLAIIPAYENILVGKDEAAKEDSKSENLEEEDTIESNEEAEDAEEVEGDSVTVSLSRDFEAIKQENEKLKKQLDEVEQKYADFKAKIEEEKAEIEREQVAKARMEELVKIGCRFDDEQYSRVKERVKNQSKEDFADFKDIISGLASKAEDFNVSKEQASDKVKKGSAKLDINALNIESKDQSLKDKYKALAKAALKLDD